MIHPYSYYPGRAAQWWPNKIAFIEGETKVTYSEFDSRISKIANTLIDLGVKKGDRVAVIHQNNISFIESICGAARAGAVIVPLLGILTEKDHVYMASDAEAYVVISSGKETDGRAAALKDKCDSVKHIITHTMSSGTIKYQDILDSTSTKNPKIYGSEDDIAQIIYTSGTTGKPKGVVHTYSSTQSAMSAWVHLTHMTNEDVTLLSLPLSHFGARLMDSGWCVGATGVIIPKPDPQLSMEAIEKHKVTIMILIPTILAMILDHPDIHKYDLSSLRFILYAAAPASATLVRKATQKFGPILHTGWGQTEAYGLNTHLTPREHEEALRSAEWRLISCGREAATDVQVRILDDKGNDVEPGEPGEACIRAPWQAKGYWNLPELTAKTFKNGWLHTRDILKCDKDGYYYVVDRKDDMIISGGYNIYPREVEEVLYSHDAVLECAVVGVPDPKWGEAVKAVVVCREGMKLTEEELIQLCKERLAPYKVPKTIDFVESLPKTSVGKIFRKGVKERYWREKDRFVAGPE
jgi:acyl-CoA synthetase (AMP-forming)/AMP-acid ligase II